MISDKFTNNSDKQLDNLPLHDIQGLVEVNDHSLLMLIVLGGVLLFLVLSGLYFAWQYFSKRKRENIRKEAYKKLKNIDFSDVKKAAYEITRLGLIFKDDSERVANKYYALIDKLESYKYRKNIDKNFDQESIAYYKNFLEMIEV